MTNMCKVNTCKASTWCERSNKQARKSLEDAAKIWVHILMRSSSGRFFGARCCHREDCGFLGLWREGGWWVGLFWSGHVTPIKYINGHKSRGEPQQVWESESVTYKLTDWHTGVGAGDASASNHKTYCLIFCVDSESQVQQRNFESGSGRNCDLRLLPFSMSPLKILCQPKDFNPEVNQ